MGYCGDTHSLYIARSGKKRKDIRMIDLVHKSITHISSPSDFIRSGGILNGSRSMYFVYRDESLHCLDFDSKKMREVLRPNSLKGYSKHFIASENRFFLFGEDGVATFDPSTAYLEKFSTEAWDDCINIGAMEPKELECFLIITKEGQLVLWDSRTNYSRIVSNWNEDWKDASASF